MIMNITVWFYTSIKDGASCSIPTKHVSIKQHNISSHSAAYTVKRVRITYRKTLWEWNRRILYNRSESRTNAYCSLLKGVLWNA